MWHDVLMCGIKGFIVAFIAFLWFRRTALWRFYYKILRDSKQLSATAPLNRKAWEQIWVIEWDLIGSLLKFEMNFLYFLIKNNQYSLWDPDQSISEELVVDKDDIVIKKVEKAILNREDYSEHVLGKIFIRRFSFIGIPLFFESLLWSITQKPSKSYSEEISSKPARNFIPKHD